MGGHTTPPCANCGRDDYWAQEGADNGQCGYCGVRDDREGLRQALMVAKAIGKSAEARIDLLEGILRGAQKVCVAVVKRGHYDTCSLSLIDDCSCSCPYELAHETAAELAQHLDQQLTPSCCNTCTGQCTESKRMTDG